MAIRFKCPACRTQLTVPNDWQGRKGTCKQCQSNFTIPSLKSTDPSSPSAPAAPAPAPVPQAQHFAAAAIQPVAEKAKSDTTSVSNRELHSADVARTASPLVSSNIELPSSVSATSSATVTFDGSESPFSFSGAESNPSNLTPVLQTTSGSAHQSSTKKSSTKSKAKYWLYGILATVGVLGLAICGGGFILFGQFLKQMSKDMERPAVRSTNVPGGASKEFVIPRNPEFPYVRNNIRKPMLYDWSFSKSKSYVLTLTNRNQPDAPLFQGEYTLGREGFGSNPDKVIDEEIECVSLDIGGLMIAQAHRVTNGQPVLYRTLRRVGTAYVIAIDSRNDLALLSTDATLETVAKLAPKLEQSDYANLQVYRLVPKLPKMPDGRSSSGPDLSTSAYAASTIGDPVSHALLKCSIPANAQPDALGRLPIDASWQGSANGCPVINESKELVGFLTYYDTAGCMTTEPHLVPVDRIHEFLSACKIVLDNGSQTQPIGEGQTLATLKKQQPLLSTVLVNGTEQNFIEKEEPTPFTKRELLATLFGSIPKSTDRSLPYMLGPAINCLVEQLDPILDDQWTWEDVQTSNEETRHRKIAYKKQTEEGSRITFERQFEMTINFAKNQKTATAKRSGTWVFDTGSGMTQSLEQDIDYVEGESAPIPLHLSIQTGKR